MSIEAQKRLLRDKRRYRPQILRCWHTQKMYVDKD